MDSQSLTALLTVLPDWQARLQTLTSRFPDQGSSPVSAVSPGILETPKEKNQASKLQLRPSTPPSTTKPTEVGNKKLLAKPGAAKAKFSSITGPDIFYDGDSQQLLFECWTAMNSNRGFLRKEMMQIKRKKVLTLPTTDYGYSDSDDEIEADSDSDDETEEDKLKRIEEEQRRAAEEKAKLEAVTKMSALLEEVDGFLDKAAKACENSAYLWLKGEGCAGHIVYITERMSEAIARIERALAPPKPAPKPAAKSAPSAAVVDEGFDEEDEGIELPHKKIARPVPDPDPVGRERRVRLQ